MSEKVKILIIRFSSIGDIVLTTPVIRCLKEQVHGESEIHFITFTRYAEILEFNPYVDHIHAVEKVSNTVVEELKSIGFHYIIDLHHNLRSMRLKSKLKVTSFSFNKLNPLKWLLVNFKVNRLPAIHIVDRYLETTKALGIQNDGKGLDYFLPPDLNAPKLPSTIQSSYIALVLSATHHTKKPTDAHFSRLIQEIKTPVVIIGGPAEGNLGERLAALDPSRIANMAGNCSVHESAILIQNSHLVITPDTGMMHIAAAFEKKIISIWGNTVPEFGMYPYLTTRNASSDLFEVKGLSCRPCSKIGFNKCPKGHFKCMENQDWEKIAERANSI